MWNYSIKNALMLHRRSHGSTLGWSTHTSEPFVLIWHCNKFFPDQFRANRGFLSFEMTVTEALFKNEGHQWRCGGVNQGHEEKEKAASQWGDIRSAVCEQSLRTGEQSRSLELRYYRLVGPSVWTCTCLSAGHGLWRDAGGGAEVFGGLSVSCQAVLHLTYSSYWNILLVFHPTLMMLSPSCPSFNSSLFDSSYLLFPFSYSPLIAIATFCSTPFSRHVLHSSPPSFKCW